MNYQYVFWKLEIRTWFKRSLLQRKLLQFQASLDGTDSFFVEFLPSSNIAVKHCFLNILNFLAKQYLTFWQCHKTLLGKQSFSVFEKVQNLLFKSNVFQPRQTVKHFSWHAHFICLTNNVWSNSVFSYVSGSLFFPFLLTEFPLSRHGAETVEEEDEQNRRKQKQFFSGAGNKANKNIRETFIYILRLAAIWHK